MLSPVFIIPAVVAAIGIADRVVRHRSRRPTHRVRISKREFNRIHDTCSNPNDRSILARRKLTERQARILLLPFQALACRVESAKRISIITDAIVDAVMADPSSIVRCALASNLHVTRGAHLERLMDAEPEVAQRVAQRIYRTPWPHDLLETIENGWKPAVALTLHREWRASQPWKGKLVDRSSEEFETLPDADTLESFMVIADRWSPAEAFWTVGASS